MKKLLLSLGALATVVAPVAAVVACSSNDNKTDAGTTGGTTGGGNTDKNTHNLPEVTQTSTKTATELKAVIIEKDDTSKTLAVKLGVPVNSIVSAGAPTYAFDTTTFKLTSTSKTAGQTFVNTLVLTPKVEATGLTDADKALTSTLFEDELYDANDLTAAMQQGNDAIDAIEMGLQITFSQNVKDVVFADQHATYTSKFVKADSKLTITVTGDSTTVYEFTLTVAKPVEVTSTKDKATLDADAASASLTATTTFAELDASFGTTIATDFAGKTLEGITAKYDAATQILKFQIDGEGQDVWHEYKISPKPTTAIS